MQDGLRLNFQVFSTKSGLSGRFYRQTKFSQRFRRKSGSGSSPSQRFSLISHESFKRKSGKLSFLPVFFHASI